MYWGLFPLKRNVFLENICVNNDYLILAEYIDEEFLCLKKIEDILNHPIYLTQAYKRYFGRQNDSNVDCISSENFINTDFNKNEDKKCL